MTDAAEAELREIRKLWDEMQYIRTGAINALFAHIDAQAAEVERLKAIERQHDELQKDWEADANVIRPLRDLVREAGEIIADYRRMHQLQRCNYGLPPGNCAPCACAAVWLEKAKR